MRAVVDGGGVVDAELGACRSTRRRAIRSAACRGRAGEGGRVPEGVECLSLSMRAVDGGRGSQS